MQQPTKADRSNNEVRRSGNSTIALAIAGTVVVGTIALTAPFVSGLRHKVYLPYMATPKGKVRKAVQYAVNHHVSCVPAITRQERHRPRKFLDLGSGDGEAVYQAVQITSPAALDLAVGVELNPTLFAIASLRRLAWTSSQRRRSLFMCDSFWNHKLQAYSIIMIFGVPPLMRDLSNKIHSECEPGTVVLSYRFPLPPREGVAKHDRNDSDDTTTVLVHQEDEMFTYVLKRSEC